jgi:high-affinity nickel-transport protein
VVWGLGHGSVLLVFGGALLLLRARIPERVGAAFELAVAAMLVALGVRALRRAYVTARGGAPVEHRHARASHVHAGPADHVHVRGFTLARQPLLIGCVHGLAGSGALAALVLAQMKSPLAGLAYLAVYGGGAMLGMATLAGLAGLPLARVVGSRRVGSMLLGTTGVLSLLLGVAWGWTAAGTAFGLT